MRKEGIKDTTSNLGTKEVGTGDNIGCDVLKGENDLESENNTRVLSKSKKERKKKRSPRLKVATKFSRGNGRNQQKRMHKAQVGQSLISDHFEKTPSKRVNVVLDFDKDTSGIENVKEDQ